MHKSVSWADACTSHRGRVVLAWHVGAHKASTNHRLSMTSTGWFRRQVVGEIWGETSIMHESVSWVDACMQHSQG